MIQNPILTGFNPDPCICRKGNDYYIAVSTFEWMPGIPVYHSKDLKNWELLTHVLTDEKNVDLSRLPSGQGIWAPDLSYCEEDGLFYVVYGVMVPDGMNIDNYVITSKDIMGPWSEPIYLQSNGFDASLFHDDDGRRVSEARSNLYGRIFPKGEEAGRISQADLEWRNDKRMDRRTAYV